MAAFKVLINCENDAFGSTWRDKDGYHHRDVIWRDEIARILRQVAERVEQGEGDGFYTTIFDVDGNDVGRFAFKEHDNAYNLKGQ